MNSFQAKIGWKRMGKRENKKLSKFEKNNKKTKKN